MKNIFLVIFSFFSMTQLSFSQSGEYFLYSHPYCTEEGIKSVQTTDDAFVMAGSQYCSPGKLYVVKINSAGSIVWSEFIRPTDSIHSFAATDIIQTLDRGFLITGVAYANSTSLYDGEVVKLDSTGHLQWAKSLAGTDEDRTQSAIQMDDSTFIISGMTKSVAGSALALLFKIDQGGNVIWTKEFLCTNAKKIIKTHDGGYAVTGSNSSGSFLIKYDGLDNLQWGKLIGGNSPTALFLYDVKECPDHGYALAGSLVHTGTNDNLVIKVDSNGSFLWRTLIGVSGNDGVNSIVSLNAGGFVAGGSTEFYGGQTGKGYLFKLDSSGAFLWGETIGDTSMINNILQMPDNGYWITGYSKVFYHNNDSKVLLMKLDSAGTNCHNYISIGNVVTIHPVIVWNFLQASNIQTVSFPFVDHGTRALVTSSFVTICNSSTVGIDAGIQTSRNEITCHPNPSSTGTFYFAFNDKTDPVKSIEVIDITGRIVFFSNRDMNEINMTSVASGIYYYHLKTCGGRTFQGKIVKG